jgi:hypothetical protein
MSTPASTTAYSEDDPQAGEWPPLRPGGLSQAAVPPGMTVTLIPSTAPTATTVEGQARRRPRCPMASHIRPARRRHQPRPSRPGRQPGGVQRDPRLRHPPSSRASPTTQTTSPAPCGASPSNSYTSFSAPPAAAATRKSSTTSADPGSEPRPSRQPGELRGADGHTMGCERDIARLIAQGRHNPGAIERLAAGTGLDHSPSGPTGGGTPWLHAVTAPGRPPFT